MEMIAGPNTIPRGSEHGLKLFALLNLQKGALLFAGAIAMLVLAMMKFYGPFAAIGFAIVMPAIIMLMLNPESILIGTVLAIFVAFQVRYTEISVIMTFFFLAAFLLNRVETKDGLRVANPLAKPFLLYLCAIVPSLYNTSDVFFSLYSMINLFSMALIAYLIGEFVTDEGKLKRSMIAYVAGCFMNGLVVVGYAVISAGRSFGFTRVVYVDLACVGIIIVIMLIIALRRTSVMPLSLLAGFFTIALLFTQTRNSLISLAVALAFLFFYLLKHGERFGIEKKRLIFFSSIVLAAGAATIAVILAVSPQVFERLAEVGSKTTVELRSEVNFGTNSLITRLLVWHTALMAFLHHPIIGIGAYAFIRDSRLYYAIPTQLYKLFVQGISPHETYLEVLVETGIVGFIAFIAFLSAAVRMGLRMVSKAVTEHHRLYALGLMVIQVYIITSMVMTDAWLVGQCGMLWGIVLGLSIALHRMIERQAVTDGSR